MDDTEQPTSDEAPGERLRPDDDSEERRREPAPAEDLEADPAYNPGDEGLRDLKGG